MSVMNFYGIMAVLKVKYLHFLYFTDILVILSNPFSMIRNQCDSLGQSRGKALKF